MDFYATTTKVNIERVKQDPIQAMEQAGAT